MSKLLKVMIVDDERLIRESLKITIDWASYGCEITAEASNAFEAISKAQKLKPDIIVTDIRMPGMDGLDMIEEIMAFNPCNFIVVTGYDDFSYAKRAVKIRAIDFILKPIDTEEFKEAVEKAVLERHKVLEQEILKLNKLFLDALRGRKPYNCLLVYKNICQVNLDRFYIALIQNDNLEEFDITVHAPILYKQNQIIADKIFQIFEDIYLIECHEDRLAAIIPKEMVDDVDKLCLKLKMLQDMVKKCVNTTISIGVSMENSLETISTAYEQAKVALQNRFYSGKGCITLFEEIKDEGNRDIEFKDSIKNEILFTLEACDKKRLVDTLENLYIKEFKLNRSNIYLIKQISLEIIGTSIELLKDYNINKEIVLGSEFSPYRLMRNLNTIDEIYEFVKGTLLKILSAIREFISNTDESDIKKALDYINQNYTENINLCEVAQYVHYSESYLSRKIKETIGMSFVQYLTKLRIEKAIELLQNPNTTVSEVAQRVGYTDYRYFSSVFQKYTGYSPKEFSKKVRIDNYIK